MALITTRKLADDLGISERQVRNLQYRHGLPWVKVGHLVRFDTDAVEAWLDARRRVKP